MRVRELIADLREFRRPLSDLRNRQDTPALSCAILRTEGKVEAIQYNCPFAPVLGDRPIHNYLTFSAGDSFALAFYAVTADIPRDRIAIALASIETITRELHPLLGDLSRPVCEKLILPDGDNWWRIVFHLGWHFPRIFLRPVRCRLLAREGSLYEILNETFVQLHGSGGLSDLLPGLIFSKLEPDLCTCSEAAIKVIIAAL